MKKTILLAALAAAASVSVYGQGSFIFDNLSQSTGPVPVTISPTLGHPGEGGLGAYIGAEYTASLYYELGTVGSQAAFDSGGPILFAGANTPFIGNTGTGPGDVNHNPNADGAGLFGGGIVNLPSGTTVSIEIRAWWNGGGTITSYDQANTAGVNVGESIPVSVLLATGAAQPAAMEGLQSFTVQSVPEPATLALCGLGAASLLLFRRKK